MEPTALTAAAIVSLAFTKVFETTVEKFTEAALAKTDRLREKIWDKLRGNHTAEVALTEVENNRSKAHLDQIAAFVQVAMIQDQQFAQKIQAIAQEINASKLQDNSMTQNNHDNSTGYQIKNEGGENYTGNITIHKT